MYFAVSERKVSNFAKAVRGRKLEAYASDFLQLIKKLQQHDLAVEAYVYPPTNTFLRRKLHFLSYSGGSKTMLELGQVVFSLK